VTADGERRQGARGGEAVVGARTLIVGVRVLFLIVAAAAVVAGVTAAVVNRGRAADTTVRYACPMHAEVRSAGPGECPICRMALERVGFVPGAVKPYLEAAGTVDLRAIDNVKKHNIVDFVRLHALLPVQSELRGPAWVEDDGTIVAVFYDDQIAAMADDEPGTFRLADAPARTFAARRTADPPAVWDRSTSRIRFRSATPRGAGPTAGRTGWLDVAPRPRQVVGVAASAVLQSPEGPYVLAWSGHDYTFVQRRVEIGETFLKEGIAVILSGLRPHDRVVARATFFVDADRRLGANTGEIALGPR
jgi:hypothetical protein